MFRLRKIKISHRRTCPKCRSQNIVAQYYGIHSVERYECLDCEDEFRGLKLLGIRVAICEESRVGEGRESPS